MMKEQLIEEIETSLEGSKKKTLRVWNILFPEERLSNDTKLSEDLQEEMRENISEELEYSEDFDSISKIYKLCTGSSIEPDDLYTKSDLNFEDEEFA